MTSQLNSESLWDGVTLKLSPILANAYQSVIHSSGLFERTQEPRPDPAPIGGISQEQTDEHFAHSFDGSASRVQLVQVDPKNEMPIASGELLRLLSGGDVCLVDIPSGAGAGALTLLANIATLRSEGVLPSQRMRVRIIWGEISDPARNYALQLAAQMEDELAAQGITFSIEELKWDILNDFDNHELVEKIAQTRANFPQTLLLVCAFSGFLQRGGKYKASERNLESVFRFCSGDMNSGIWIEPAKKGVRKDLFDKIVRTIARLGRFMRLANPSVPHEASSTRFTSPMVAGLTPRVNAIVMPIDLDRQR